MSGVLKAVGKVFKKVVKVVKKVALPALAIGAVVLTGGAALGVLPSIGALGSSLGLSAGLTSVLSSAASAATVGAVGSALTGGNIVKGATAGFVTGGLVGGIGQAMSKAGSVAAGGGGSVANAAASAAPAASNGFTVPIDGSPSFASAGPAAIGAGMPAMASGGGNVVSGAFDFLGKNPMIAGSLVQGIGQGMMAKGQLKAQRKAEEREAANYDDTSQLFRLSSNSGQQSQQQGPEEIDGSPIPYTGGAYVYDRNSGTVRIVRGA